MLNVKAIVGAFNQEKALVGAFSVIVQPFVEPMDRFTALVSSPPLTCDLPGGALESADILVCLQLEKRFLK